jgi:hypothetical protein
MDSELVKEIVKGGVAVILSVGLVGILYEAVRGDKAEMTRQLDLASRQTVALEQLVQIYSGGKTIPGSAAAMSSASGKP